MTCWHWSSSLIRHHATAASPGLHPSHPGHQRGITVDALLIYKIKNIILKWWEDEVRGGVVGGVGWEKLQRKVKRGRGSGSEDGITIDGRHLGTQLLEVFVTSRAQRWRSGRGFSFGSPRTFTRCRLGTPESILQSTLCGTGAQGWVSDQFVGVMKEVWWTTEPLSSSPLSQARIGYSLCRLEALAPNAGYNWTVLALAVCKLSRCVCLHFF